MFNHCSRNRGLWMVCSLVTALLLGPTLTVAQPSACSASTDLETIYGNESNLLVVRPLLQGDQGGQRVHAVVVQKVYKGCFAPGQHIQVSTPAPPSPCTVAFPTGDTLIASSLQVVADTPTLSLTGCDYSRPVRELNADERAFLDSLSPVDTTFCPPAQACTEDRDCSDGFWCRPAADESNSECVPFAGRGESCGGFTILSQQERCAPHLVCDGFATVLDAAGTCRQPCDTSDECDAEQYCARDGLCQDNGRCDIPGDCLHPDNLYPTPRCLGYPSCEISGGGTCHWNCSVGGAQCVDLTGLDLGPCRRILGYGVVDGVCKAVSGCSAAEFSSALFESQLACQRACPDSCQPDELFCGGAL